VARSFSTGRLQADARFQKERLGWMLGDSALIRTHA
jgi:hypothetical protein